MTVFDSNNVFYFDNTHYYVRQSIIVIYDNVNFWR